MKKEKIIIGITGGIGSGKSTVAKLFEQKGIPVYYADDRAKALMNENIEVIDQLKTEFGEDVYKNGRLDRAYLASMTFSNPEKLIKLNAIVHPAVFRDNEEWTKAQHSPIVMKEAAIMIESGSYRLLDELIVVSANEAVRIQRVLERDNTSREAVEARINNQLSEEERLKYADYIIENNLGLTELAQEVERVYQEIKTKYYIA
ncbi:dephospho-CoA kinase [Vaginella massiliensis]|uniref:dephospho-CoA kinase n=1 Tax=Vaginella massiliensis TaxID=1816680 RepID=UPI0008382F87|nr:dephospho-CoA kinase [Vaginella massiliensis]